MSRRKRGRLEREADKLEFDLRLAEAAAKIGVPVPNGDGYVPVKIRVEERLAQAEQRIVAKRTYPIPPPPPPVQPA